jgi:raffinose/stachyose/melibiose transport system substrate-binding protein
MSGWRRHKWRIFWAGLAVAFAICTVHIVRVSLRSQDAGDDRKVLRIGHYLLHSGVRDALQDVIDEYERRHPDVHLVQVAVPERTYLQFLRTQLVAGTAPDILQLGAHLTGMEEMRARYFRPITAWVEEPNPYNAGTDLAGRRWRDTFVDGLDNAEAYSPALRHFYGVPLTVAGVRIFYNLAMLRELTGGERLPQTYDELIALCRVVEAHNRRDGGKIVPFAGSRMSALFLMAPLVSSVSQRLYYEMAADHSLQVTDWDYGLAYLQGRWSFDSPAIRRGYALTRELAQYQKPGFYQLSPPDAAMQFLQGQSLMLTTFVLDVSNLKAQAAFPIGAAPIPALTPADPTYGADVLGPVSELSSKASGNFGIVASSPHAAEAVDFLRFLGSKEGMEIFSRRSNWLPSVTNVEVADWMKQMQPVQAGYAGRFFAEYAGKGDARFVIGNQLHLLIGQGGSVDAFLAMARANYGPAIRTDLLKDNRESLQNLRRQEPGLLADYQQASATAAAAGDFWRDVSSQNGYEARMLRNRLILSQTENP